MKKTTLSWILTGAIILASAAGTTLYLRGISHSRKLVVLTTTSLYDTGLLDAIEETFEHQYPIDLYFIAMGTGQAIEHAKRGDADLILCHAPSQELAFLTEGYGVCRKIIAYNFFVIVGPSEDPAKTKGSSVKDSVAKIADAGRSGSAIWISRGDDSGTHLKEKSLWAVAGLNWSSIREERGWYIEASAGMGNTLLVADEKEAYTLSDIGTYLKYQGDNTIGLKILVGEDKDLLNVYSVIAVNPERMRGINFEDAVIFTKFLISNECQDLMASFKSDVFGRNLFFPAVRLLKENLDPAIAQWIRQFAFFNGTECPEEYRGDHPELYKS